MKREVKNWTVEKVYKERENISFPDYQREPTVWSRDDKKLLIDSILGDIDIPKLYFYKTVNGSYEVVDGQQRLWALWDFIDNEYAIKRGDKNVKFDDLDDGIKQTIRDFKLQVTEIEDLPDSEEWDDYLRKLFLRLQLGKILVPGEKLHAETGVMRDFVFNDMVKHLFIDFITIPPRRFAKETLCAQICSNHFSMENANAFSRTRYGDLSQFFKYYKKPQGNDLQDFENNCKSIKEILDRLKNAFGKRGKELKNRSYVLSIYFFVYKLLKKYKEEEIGTILPDFVKFSLVFMKRLKAEAKKGFGRTNKDLYIFESYLSNAPGEAYQIERRHKKMKEFFNHYQNTGEILGD